MEEDEAVNILILILQMLFSWIKHSSNHIDDILKKSALHGW